MWAIICRKEGERDYKFSRRIFISRCSGATFREEFWISLTIGRPLQSTPFDLVFMQMNRERRASKREKIIDGFVSAAGKLSWPLDHRSGSMNAIFPDDRSTLLLYHRSKLKYSGNIRFKISFENLSNRLHPSNSNFKELTFLPSRLFPSSKRI